jgi:hypothetical protein
VLDRWAPVSVALIIFLVFSSSLFSGRFLIDNPALVDVSFSFMPLIHWMGQSYQAGEFPLWNPHILFGMPLLAHSHCGGMYPISALLFSLLPYLWAGSVTIVFHSVVVGLLFYALMRRQGVIPVISAGASLVFVLSGTYFASIYVIWMMGSMCGLLAMWICFQSFCRRPRLSSFLGGSLATAWCCVSGDVELLTYGLMALYLLIALEPGLNVRDRIGRLALISCPAVCGGLVMSVTALPTLENLQFSIRGPLMPFHMEIDILGDNAYFILPTWIQPFRYYREVFTEAAFNSGLSALYNGFTTLALTGWGLVYSLRRKKLRPQAISFAGMIIFTVIREWEPAAAIIGLIPVLGDLHTTYKTLLIVHALGVMVGFQVLSDAVRNSGKNDRALIIGVILILCGALVISLRPWSMGGFERLLIGIAAVVVGAAAMAAPGGRPLLSNRSAAYLLVTLTVMEVVSLAARYVPRTAPEQFALDNEFQEFARGLDPQTRYAVFEHLLSVDPEAPAPLFGLFETASGAANIIGPARVRPARVFLYHNQIYGKLIYFDSSGNRRLSGWTMTNPGTLDRGRMHLFNLAGTEVVISRDMVIPYSSPYSLLRLASTKWTQKGGGMRWDSKSETVRASSPSRAQTFLPGLAGDRLRIKGRAEQSIWLSLTTDSGGGRKQLMFCRFAGHGEPFQNVMDMTPFPGREIRLQLHVTAPHPGNGSVISELEIINPGRAFQRSGKWESIEAFENREALPRAFIAHQPVIAEGMEEMIDLISDPLRFAPGRQVALEKAYPEVEIVRRTFRGDDTGEGVRIISYGRQRVEMEARLTSPGFLVFTDTYFPGWKAFVHRREQWIETRAYPADLAFRTIFLPEGTHRVKWVYMPAAFEIGLWTTITSLAGLLGLSVPALIRKLRPETGAAGD